ncbi:cytochrome D1 domain-containing protein [Hydrogenivirga sp.]
MLPLILLLLLVSLGFSVKVYVVEREQGAVAVVENGKLVGEIKGVGNTNHATLKFLGRNAYMVSRDGFLSKIDTERDRLVGKVRVGESTIGFTFCSGKVAVANYAPDTVVFLSEDLDVLKEIDTGSRNVGIKTYGGKLVFSLMDRDEVWVLDCESFEKVGGVDRAGSMPFDALLSGSRYIVGFFNENAVGVLNLKDMSYRKVTFGREGREVVLKIPHFGLWGVYGRLAYIPGVKERKVHVVDIERFEYLGSIDVPGLPVFVSVSPDGRYVAVNFSGDREDYLTLIDRESGRVVLTKELGKRILHFRFTPDGRYLYLSSYYENKLKKVSVPELKVIEELSVPTPSGVFIKGG